MPSLRDKTILLISPQAWGDMFISKHHYAIELANRGNVVFFLTPLEFNKERNSKIQIHNSVYSNLFFIEHHLFFPFQVKFHAIGLFNFLMRIQLKRIIKKINKPIDIIWSFDLGNFFPLNLFETKSYKIFHPVDEPLNNAAMTAAAGADIIFSVTKEILSKYERYNIPKHFINHGVSNVFTSIPNSLRNKSDQISVGLSGNLLVNYIDQKTLLQIIRGHTNIRFKFWGSYDLKESNIGGSEVETVSKFINELKHQANVLLHGTVSPHELALAFQQVDAFLLCYDINKEQSKGTNYHKIMEYLSTGKVIISNNITTYQNNSSLIQMTAEREDNNSLPALFHKVINNLEYHNSQKFREERIAFARDNTYAKQLDKIESIISNS